MPEEELERQNVMVGNQMKRENHEDVKEAVFLRRERAHTFDKDGTKTNDFQSGHEHVVA